MNARAAIFGCSGPSLTTVERDFFAEARPWGFILFARNVEAPDQVRRLVAELRAAVGWQAPVLIDQEGGRVARLRPPHWRDWPALPEALAALGPGERAGMIRHRYENIARELASLGIDVNCVPMLDVPGPGAHAIITSRVLGDDASTVAELGAVVAEATRAGGVLPVIKHIPGHGRTGEDSHEVLPRVTATLSELEAVDFAPFQALAGEALGMTAHVIYDALDPAACATLSAAGIAAIRERIGFDGLLMTDDISMGALTGPLEGRVRRALDAGCDVILHCNGDLGEMTAIADVVPMLAAEAARRADAAIAVRNGLGMLADAR